MFPPLTASELPSRTRRRHSPFRSRGCPGGKRQENVRKRELCVRICCAWRRALNTRCLPRNLHKRHPSRNLDAVLSRVEKSILRRFSVLYMYQVRVFWEAGSIQVYNPGACFQSGYDQVQSLHSVFLKWRTIGYKNCTVFLLGPVYTIRHRAYAGVFEAGGNL